jgi:prevent-host-death family protein
MTANTWKLQDAKARFSEVVRKARAGKPQVVTVHGEPAVTITAAKKTNPRSAAGVMTTADFIEQSKKYRGLGLKIPPRTKMKLRWDPPFGDGES